MKDIRVTFKTAKLAKEKGFSVGTHGCLVHYKTSQTHPEDGNSGPFGWEKGEITSDSSFIINGREDLGDYSNENYDCYELPTQSLLQKWLREVHNKHIFIGSRTLDSGKTIYIPQGRTIPDTIKNGFVVDFIVYKTFEKYEDALEYALQEALKLI
jgi:hypothetical protein